MRIAIIGTGDVAVTLLFRCSAASHDVISASLDDPRSGDELRPEWVSTASVADAVRWSDIAIISIPFGRYGELQPGAFEGHITVDASDYFAGRDGPMQEIDDGVITSSEVLAQHLAGSRPVKAFNTINLLTLSAFGPFSGDVPSPALPIAGDDGGAKLLVAGLVVDLGFTPLDVGTLADSWRLQPGMPVYGMVASPDELRAVLMVP